MWINSTLVYPTGTSTAPPANPDMPVDVRRDYDEARSIAELSPRGAGALLRLALQRLLQQLAGHTGKIDDLIYELEAKGMSRVVADMNHSIRVIGNNAVHPLELDLNEQPDMVAASFQLLNYIVEDQITRPRLANEMMARLPEGAKKAISNRRERDEKRQAG